VLREFLEASPQRSEHCQERGEGVGDADLDKRNGAVHSPAAIHEARKAASTTAPACYQCLTEVAAENGAERKRSESGKQRDERVLNAQTIHGINAPLK